MTAYYHNFQKLYCKHSSYVTWKMWYTGGAWEVRDCPFLVSMSSCYKLKCFFYRKLFIIFKINFCKKKNYFRYTAVGYCKRTTWFSNLFRGSKVFINLPTKEPNLDSSLLRKLTYIGLPFEFWPVPSRVVSFTDFNIDPSKATQPLHSHFGFNFHAKPTVVALHNHTQSHKVIIGWAHLPTTKSNFNWVVTFWEVDSDTSLIQGTCNFKHCSSRVPQGKIFSFWMRGSKYYA